MIKLVFEDKDFWKVNQFKLNIPESHYFEPEPLENQEPVYGKVEEPTKKELIKCFIRAIIVAGIIIGFGGI